MESRKRKLDNSPEIIELGASNVDEIIELSDDEPCATTSAKKASTSRTHIGNRPVCKYGADCYRTNTAHMEEFSHPSTNFKIQKQKQNKND